MGDSRVTIYETLVDRMFSIPDRDRYKCALMLTWAEFCEVWYQQWAMDDQQAARSKQLWAEWGIVDEVVQTVKHRPPTLADARGAMILGRPIVISDAWDNWPPPAVDAIRYRWTHHPDPEVRLVALPIDPTSCPVS